MSAGKGDKNRIGDKKAFDERYADIFGKKRVSADPSEVKSKLKIKPKREK